MINNSKSAKPKSKQKNSPKPARKTRTKTRKPKYLSLKLQLSPSPKNKTRKIIKPTKMSHKQQQHQQHDQQLNLFPLHPENKDYLHDQDHVAAFLFDTSPNSSATLSGLLDATTSEEGPLCSSFTQVYGDVMGCGRGVSSLVRTAMRRKERDASEDKWVSYWEVVEKKEQEEVSSSSSNSTTCYGVADALGKMVQVQGLVGLKLDYQEILDAWSDKGSLYITEDSSPQTVPDLLHPSNAVMDDWESVGNLWKVPEMGDSMKRQEKMESCKSRQREASVLRYKEKRQSRLFSKRIRYQVRKLNAEKRPRLKGRFVKRIGEV